MRCDTRSIAQTSTIGSFNPHTYMRCDISSLGISSYLAKFQSTHLHEVWPLILLICFMIISFNPHTYMRCDVEFDVLRHSSDVSIHTPTWGVTFKTLYPCHIYEVSIHTPTWGVTYDVSFLAEYLTVSIHTPTWGVTAQLPYRCYQIQVSIHTPTWGVTCPVRCIQQNPKFQSTHLHEVWLPQI